MILEGSTRFGLTTAAIKTGELSDVQGCREDGSKILGSMTSVYLDPEYFGGRKITIESGKRVMIGWEPKTEKWVFVMAEFD